MNLERLDSSIRCRPLWRRHRFIWPLLGFVCLAGIATWHHLSPRPSLGALALSYQRGWVEWQERLIDQKQVLHSVADEVAPLLVQANEQNAAQVATLLPVLSRLVASALPVLSASKESLDRVTVGVAKKDAANVLLATLLQVDAQVWQQWQQAVVAGRFTVGSCRREDARAACEIVIHGPDAQDIVLATLWQRQDFYWQLKGVAGLGLWVEWMRQKR